MGHHRFMRPLPRYADSITGTPEAAVAPATGLEEAVAEIVEPVDSVFAELDAVDSVPVAPVEPIEPVETAAPAQEAQPVTPAPAQAPVVAPTVVEQAPVAPVTPAASVAAPSDPRDAQIAELKKELFALSKRLTGKPEQAAQPAQAQPQQPPVAQQVQQQPQAQAQQLVQQQEAAPAQAPLQFIPADFTQQLVDSPENAVATLNTAFHNAIAIVLRTIPAITSPIVQQQVTADRLVSRFWEANQDLAADPETRNFVLAAADIVQSEHPDWTRPDGLPDFGKIFTETGERVRRVLRVASAQAQPAGANQTPPMLAPAPMITAIRPVRPELSGIEADLAELDRIPD